MIRLYLLCVVIASTLVAISSGCNPRPNEDYLLKVLPQGEEDEVGARCGYVNSSTGDTVIALGKYYYCYTDTIRTYGIVLKHDNTCVAIDKKGKELFRVYWFDNGPDYASDGLFRIIQNGKIGYADTTGKIKIPPKFDCAEPFENGTARVSLHCTEEADREHRVWASEQWFWIDKAGTKVH